MLAKGTALAATGVIVIVNFALKEIIPRMSASEVRLDEEQMTEGE